MARKMHMRAGNMLVAVLVIALAMPSAAFGSPARAATVGTERVGEPRSRRVTRVAGFDFVPGEVIVRFKPTATSAQKNRAMTAAGATASAPLGRTVSGLTKVRLPQGQSVKLAVAAYARQPGVAYAQPNYIKRAAALPNDPSFNRLWGLSNSGQTGGTIDADIDALEAWSVAEGSQEVTIAVIDTGIDYLHPDLLANAWTNPGEIASNGVDDDHNGYIDDVHGWDTANDDGDPMDDYGHGTHVSGTIGANADNGVGVAGVNWSAKLIGIKMLDSQGSGTTADEIEAFEYAKKIGAKVISCSWGGYSTVVDLAERDEIASLDALVVCAAGNETNDNDVSSVKQGGYHYPSSLDLANVIAVGASDEDDQPADFSNWGATSVDLYAPGADIYSTLPASFDIPSGAVLLDEPFNAFTKWHNYADPSMPTWGINTLRYVSGPSSAHVSTTAHGDSWLDALAPVDFSDADASYLLKFKTDFALESDYDYLTVYATNNPTDHWDLVDWRTGTTAGTWDDVYVDLSSYAGEPSVYLSVGMRAGYPGASASNVAHVYLDDLKVVGGTASTSYDAAYGSMSGTSMATPHVSGVAALMLSVNPALTPAQLKANLMGTVDQKTSLDGLCVTGGRLNAHQAVLASIADGTGSISGHVTAGGAPLSGVTVSTDGGTTTTDANGAYTLSSIDTGAHDVTFAKAHYGTAQSTIAVLADRTTTLNKQLVPNKGTLAGTVRSGGVAVSGVTVTVAGKSALTNASGSYSVSGIAPGTYSASYSKPGYFASTNNVTIISDATTTQDASLDQTPGSVVGVVTDAGVGVAGARVTVGAATATTAGDGTFTVAGLAPGTHNFTVSAVGYSPVSGSIAVASEQSTALTVTLARIVPKASIAKSPSKSSLTYKRKKGVAKFKLSATFKGWNGAPLAKRTVFLQTSKNGKTGWKNTYKLTTSSTGKASKSFKIKRAGTKYYRWYAPAKSRMNLKTYAAKQKVRVR